MPDPIFRYRPRHVSFKVIYPGRGANGQRRWTEALSSSLAPARLWEPHGGV